MTSFLGIKITDELIQHSSDQCIPRRVVRICPFIFLLRRSQETFFVGKIYKGKLKRLQTTTLNETTNDDGGQCQLGEVPLLV